MFVPISLWTPTAEILGLRADAPFVSGIWHIITSLTVKAGFVLPPWVYLIGLTALGAWLYWRFVRFCQVFGISLALLIWGVVCADTPYVLVVVAAAELFRFWVYRQLKRKEITWKNAGVKFPRGAALRIFAIGFVPMVVGNLMITGLDGYVIGYAHKAYDDLVAFSDTHPIDEWRARSIVKEYARGVAEELGDCEWFFFDGTCDDGIRLYAAEKGKMPRMIPLIGGKQIDVPQLTRCEDQAALAEGGMALLKSWVENDRVELKTAAVQTGYNLWKAKKRVLPRPGAFMAFCGGGGFIETALPDRIFDFYANGGKLENLSPDVRKMFVSIHWRLARLAQMRGEWYDRHGEAENARAEMDLADRLDVINPEAKKVFKELDRLMTSSQLVRTPREGLDFALKTANFALAHQLAKTILVSEPDDIKANFAAGMDHLMQENFALAEYHLKIVLKTCPNDPAVLNNLAIALHKSGKLEEALKCAEAAHKASPDSIEVKETLRTINGN